MNSESDTDTTISTPPPEENERDSLIKKSAATAGSTKESINTSQLIRTDKPTTKKGFQLKKKSTKKAANTKVSQSASTSNHGVELEGEENAETQMKEEASDGKDEDRYYIRSTESSKFLYIDGNTLRFGDGPDKDSDDGAKINFIWTIKFNKDGTSFIYSTVDEENNIYWRNKHGIFTLKKKDSLLLNKRISLTSDDKRIDRKLSWNIFVTLQNQIRIRSTQNNKFIRVDKDDNMLLSRYKRGRDGMLFDIIPVESYTGNEDEDISSLTNDHKKFLKRLEDDYAESN